MILGDYIVTANMVLNFLACTFYLFSGYRVTAAYWFFVCGLNACILAMRVGGMK